MSTAVFPVWLSFWQSVSRRGYGVWSLVGRAVQSPSTDPVRSARGAFLLVLVQQGPDRHRCEGRAGPARRRATRRSRVGTPLPVPTGPGWYSAASADGAGAETVGTDAATTRRPLEWPRHSPRDPHGCERLPPCCRLKAQRYNTNPDDMRCASQFRFPCHFPDTHPRRPRMPP